MVENRPYLKFFTHLFLIVGIIVMLFPVWIALMASTHTGPAIHGGVSLLTPGSAMVENYVEAFSPGQIARGFPSARTTMVNSFIMALVIAVGKIIISLMSAFALIYFRFPFRNTAFWLIFITLMLPVEVRIMPTYQVIVDLGLLNSYSGLTIPLIASATATFLYRQFFLTIPDELTEAARVDGAGPLRFFLTIIVPMSITNTAALFVIQFVYGWNQYLWPLLIAPDPDFVTVVMGIGQMTRTVNEAPIWNMVMTVTILAAIPPVTLVILMRKLFVRGLTETEK